MSPLDTMEHYPQRALSRLKELEALIDEISSEGDLGPVITSIKWGQASYQAPKGTPIRLGWDAKSPDACYLYFHCQTKIIATVREVYGTELNLIANRAIELPLDQPVPKNVLRQCIGIALNYTQLKHLPLLGL